MQRSNMDVVFYLSIILVFITDVYTFEVAAKQCLYSEEKHLDCSHRGLISVPKDIPYDVKTINLYGNNINEIHSYTFFNLTQLTDIVLSENAVSLIKNMSFSSLPKLKFLHLDNNALGPDSIELMAFDLLESLVQLFIIKNNMYNSLFPNFALRRMPQLRSIEFNVFDEFRFKNFYQDLPSIDRMMLYSPCCYILRNITFSDVKNAQIKTLDVHLTMIETGALCNFKQLDELIFYVHLSADIMEDIFQSLQCLQNRSLTSLVVMGNKVAVNLGKNILQPLSKICIKQIRLIGDSITRIEGDAFQKFAVRAHCLEELDLSENPVATDTVTWVYFFSLFKKLKIIRLSQMHYDVRKIYKCNLSDCQYSKELHFNFPRTIQEIYIQYVDQHNHISTLKSTGTEHLAVLDLSYLTVCACDIVFKGVSNLRYLDTSGWCFLSVRRNFLGTLPNLRNFKSEHSFLGKAFKNNDNIKHFFQNSTKLNHIDLHGNGLKDLPSIFFDPVMNSLRTLNLSNNNIPNIPLEVNKFPYLMSVDLRNNMINTISLTEREFLSKATNVKIYLTGNPFLCLCETLQFLLWQNLSMIEDYRDLICSTESGKPVLVNEFLSKITEFEQHCLDKKWIYIGATVAAFVVLVIIFGTIYYKYQYTFQYWYFVVLKRFHDTTTPKETLPCLFDAFISYSHKDWGEVRPIVRRLEKQNINIAFDHKTFIPGRSIAENVVETIDNSGKVIFFVTEDFLKSGWGSYEVEMARMHAFRNFRRHMIIIIIKKNIVKENLPDALKNIWRQVTCVELPKDGDTVEQKLFHAKLIASVKQ